MKNLVLLVLFTIVLSVELWGEVFRNKKVHFNCDNMGVVMAINNISASSPLRVWLLRYLVLSCLRMNTFIYAAHIPGTTNKLADALSRFQWDEFLLWHRRRSSLGCLALGRCGGLLWNHSWTDPGFTQRWNLGGLFQGLAGIILLTGGDRW